MLKWTDGTYLEAQDKYRYNGIFRDVTLIARPKSAVVDYTVRTTLSEDNTKAEVFVRLDSYKGLPNVTVSYLHQMAVSWQMKRLRQKIKI